MQRVSRVTLVLALITGCALGQSTSPSGSIRGLVFTTEQNQAPSAVPGTKLSLDGAVHIQVESDSQGTFLFSTVPVGVYTITAQAPGLTATQNIDVLAGSVSQLELELKLQIVAESTTVTASLDPADAKESSGANTIGESLKSGTIVGTAVDVNGDPVSNSKVELKTFDSSALRVATTAGRGAFEFRDVPPGVRTSDALKSMNHNFGG